MRIGNHDIRVDFDHPIDISIPLRSGSKNPNCYSSDQPEFRTIFQGDFVGNVAQGGPCNHQRIEFSPHGNGTHTECYGHISDDPAATINRCLKQFHFTAELVSVKAEKNQAGDQVISWNSLTKKLNAKPQALIIRTLPNNPGKLIKQYSGSNPPYLETAAAGRLADIGIDHLLVDLPSIDPERDGGLLLAHRAFWNYPQRTRSHCTITELVYAPESVPDGSYLLNLQIISLESDASPSKPVLYRIIPGNFQ